MAYDRKGFKNKLLGTLSGAITHFYMVKFAERNGQTKWVEHWRTEIDRLVNMDLVVTLVSEIKGKWDKKRALEESLADVQAADRRYRTAAAHYVARVYSIKKLSKNLAPGVETEFFDLVRQAVESALSPQGEPDES
jgi:hypothetical protein